MLSILCSNCFSMLFSANVNSMKIIFMILFMFVNTGNEEPGRRNKVT